jgi:hypothetical protein
MISAMSQADVRWSERLGRLRVIDLFAAGMFIIWGAEKLVRRGPSQWLAYLLILGGVVLLLPVVPRTPPSWLLPREPLDVESAGFYKRVGPRNVWIVGGVVCGIGGLFMLPDDAVAAGICFGLGAVSMLLAVWMKRRRPAGREEAGA